MLIEIKQIFIWKIIFAGPMPEYWRNQSAISWPKGVANRNKGLHWIYHYTQNIGDTSGVLYFADDDNTYDIRLFEEVRWISDRN